jgi:hypothetical protein
VKAGDLVELELLAGNLRRAFEETAATLLGGAHV